MEICQRSNSLGAKRTRRPERLARFSFAVAKVRTFRKMAKHMRSFLQKKGVLRGFGLFWRGRKKDDNGDTLYNICAGARTIMEF